MAIVLSHCKRWLATIWFVGSGVIFFLVLIQSLLGHYGDGVNQVWGWLLPTVMPTLSLIVSVLVFEAVQHKKGRAATMDRFLFVLTASLSGAYLASVLLVILLQPLTPLPPLQAMAQSNVWLGPFQGLVAAAMGAFFVRAAQQGSDASAERGATDPPGSGTGPARLQPGT